jgi:hypothetical protein
VSSRKVAKRRSAEIHAYVGANGSFKSFCAVRDTIPSFRYGRRVYSTLAFLNPDREARCAEEATEAWLEVGALGDPHARRHRPLALPHPLWRPVQSWKDLMEVEELSDLLLDEVAGIVNSRAHQSLPPAVMNRIHQMRRQDVLVRWTTPAYQRADVSLREVTKAVTYCVGQFPTRPSPCALDCEQDHKHVEARLWGRNRLAVWRTYDALDFDEFTSADVARSRQAASKSGAQKAMRRLVLEFHYRRPGDLVTRYYETMFPVLTITDVTEAGTCLDCGGHRRRPACSCQPATGSEDVRAKRGARRPGAALPAAAVAS